MFGLGRPFVNAEKLTPGIPREAENLCKKPDCIENGIVRKSPPINSLTRFVLNTCASLIARPCAVRFVFWMPATNGPKSNRCAANTGVGRQHCDWPCGALSEYFS